MNNKPKVTPWIDGRFHPAIPGFYERRGKRELVFYSEWNGAHWMVSPFGPLNSLGEIRTVLRSNVQSLRWRGLAVKP